MTRHDDRLYLTHIVSHAREAIDLLDKISAEELGKSRVLQLALFHLVEIIGEASTRVSQETRASLPNVPWRGAVSMRNRIIHGYDTVKPETLWNTIVEDLPPLVAELERYLAS